MFDIFKSKNVPPQISSDNPGTGHTLEVAFADGEKTWSEKVNLVQALSKVLDENKLNHKSYQSWITLSNGLVLQPQIVSLTPLDDGGVNTMTTIEVANEGNAQFSLFEYQHSTGQDTEASIIDGFQNWAKTDLITIIDSISDEMSQCSSMVMNFPDRENDRVIVLGPISYYMTDESDTEEEHPFCPCCFFTNNFKAFEPLINDDNVYGIRFFAVRNEDDTIEADCRVNGIDFESGKNSLIEYGATWPNRGFEFRKQYVVMKSVLAQK